MFGVLPGIFPAIANRFEWVAGYEMYYITLFVTKYFWGKCPADGNAISPPPTLIRCVALFC